jgi:uncharacterized membrane protein YccC
MPPVPPRVPALELAAARLRDTARTLVQAAAAVGLAWFAARQLPGHDAPFFAPIAAILTLGLSAGQRLRRAVEVVAGVAVGIAVADLLVVLIGSGAVQLALVVGLAMAVAVALTGSPLLVTQAAVSAVLVVTLEPPVDGVSFARSVDALVGGAVALVLGLVVLPADPLALVRGQARPVLEELAGVLDDVAAALVSRAPGDAEAALVRARGLDERAEAFAAALADARELSATGWRGRRSRGTLALFAGAVGQVGLAVRNVRVLARGTLRAIELGDRVPPELATAVGELAASVRGLHRALDGEVAVEDARAPAATAARRATAVLEQTGNLSVSVLVGQVRSTAVDLLRGTGLARDEAQALVRGVPGAPG